MNQYLLHVEVDPEVLRKESGTSDVLSGIRSEAGWMEESGIYVCDVEEEDPEPSVYVYKEHVDSNPYGDEIVEVYKDKETALERLKASVEAWFGVPFDEVHSKGRFSEADTCRKDYVSHSNGDGVEFWIVTKLPILTAPAKA